MPDYRAYVLGPDTSCRILALLRHADRFSQCPLLGEDRKCSAHCQNDAIDPKATIRDTGNRAALTIAIVAISSIENVARPGRSVFRLKRVAPGSVMDMVQRLRMV